MSQFGEFDVPEPEGMPQKPVKPLEKAKEESLKNDTPRAPRPSRTPSRGFSGLSSLFSKLIQPLLIIGGGWVVYNWFIVDKHGLNDEGSIFYLAGGAIVAFSVFSFLMGLVGKAIGGFFKLFRTLFGIALFGFLIYSFVQYIN